MRRPDGYAVTFTYDAFGRRLSKRFWGQVTRWVWDGDEPLHEWQALEVGPGAGSAGEVLTWLFEDDSFAPLAKLTKQGASSVVCDHLGTPLSLHDAKGAVTWNLYLTAMAACAKGEVRRRIVLSLPGPVRGRGHQSLLQPLPLLRPPSRLLSLSGPCRIGRRYSVLCLCI
jgi:YD repeat-containing protein